MWLPRFACPDCAALLDEEDADRYVCPACGQQYVRSGDVWQFLSASRRSRLESFAQQYRSVRQQEGRRSVSAAYYRGLPSVPGDDPHAHDWAIRQETYRHLLRHVLAAGRQPSAVLDLGAGSAWLSHRLSTFGHHVVALDAMDDADDGLGAVRHYDAEIVAVRADFDALPFAPGQFDVVVFNGSLHYAPDGGASGLRARRMLAGGGAIVVMDSPMFRSDRDGAAMVTRTVRRFAAEFGLEEVVRPGCGYLTFSRLAASADAMQMQAEFLPSRGPVRWRVGRQLARLKLGRQPASFGLWVAR